MSDNDTKKPDPSLANIPAGLAVHATGGLAIGLAYAACFWGAVFAGAKEETERREERK